MNPSLTFGEQLPPLVRDEFDRILANIGTGWSKDHRADGTHADIHQYGRTQALGVPQNVPVYTSSFAAQAGTLTPNAGSPVDYTYDLVGRMLELSLYMNATTSLATQYLLVSLPPGFKVARTQRALTGWLYDVVGGAGYPALMVCTAGQTTVGMYRYDLGNIPATASLEACFKFRIEVTG